MKMRSLVRSVCLCAVLLTACTSVPSRFYQLQATTMPGQKLQPGAVLLVEQVTLPAGMDRPQLMRESREGRPQLQEQDYWTASPSRLLTQSVAGNLARQLGLSTVYAAPQLSLGRSDLSLQLDVREFRLRHEQGAWLAAAWRLVQPGSRKVLLQGYFSQQQPVSVPGNAALVAAQQQLLDALSQQIGDALVAHPDYLQAAS
jgi:uncharacterized lipoprotein YmbA